MDASSSRQPTGGDRRPPHRTPGTATKSAARKKALPPPDARDAANPPPPAVRPLSGVARKSGVSGAILRDAMRPPAEPPRVNRPLQRPIAGVRRVSKTAQQVRAPPQRPANDPRARAQPEQGVRKVVRKVASAMPTSQRRPQSSFNFIAPLVRTRDLPAAKSVPLKPVFHLLSQRAVALRPKVADDDTGDAPKVRNTPRASAAAMSVQRRAGISPRKAVAAAAQASPLRRRAGAPPRLQPGQAAQTSDVSSTSEDSDDGDIPPRIRLPQRQPSAVPASLRQTATKAARKQPIAADSSVRSLGKAARKLRISSDDEAAENSNDPDDDLDIDELLDAFDAITSSALRLQEKKRLPFLLRNLRAGFERCCAQRGVRMHPEEKPKAAVEVVYRYYPDGYEEDEDSSDEEQEFQAQTGFMSEWYCPLCQLYTPFQTKDMLAFHLRRDHRDVKVSWTEVGVQDARSFRIVLILPDYDELDESTSDEDEEEHQEEQEIIKPEPEEHEVDAEGSRQTSERLSSPPDVSRTRDPLFLPGSDDEESIPDTNSPSLTGVESKVELKTFDRMSVVPEVRYNHSVVPEEPRDHEESLGSQIPRVSTYTSYRGSLPNRYPSPPPPADPLGPAAQYPYLPATNSDGQEAYSCRIGGPRIYDLLNDMPLDKFGIMSWAIVDREEELFEMDDVSDEDKVMLALWNRWIMLHKTDFIFGDYLQGVKSFLDEYWRDIHKAAGWRALRAFLLMLNVNRYLTLANVIDALKHYESMTGMDLWYKEGAE
ncbi:hypothetical protein C2E23DRAFT_838624 [Lenzites betulinus]|nr:hypothetical protein C2E23DRAFT_838624 [Lenzites betulinus]